MVWVVGPVGKNSQIASECEFEGGKMHEDTDAYISREEYAGTTCLCIAVPSIGASIPINPAIFPQIPL